MPKIIVQLIIDVDHGYSFEFEGAHANTALRIWNWKLKEAREEGRKEIVQNIINGITNFIEK